MKTFFSEEKLIKQLGNSTSLSKRTPYFWANQNPPLPNFRVWGEGGGGNYEDYIANPLKHPWWTFLWKQEW